MSKVDVESWRETVTCPVCETVFEIGARDVQVDNFKEPGTYWFDGSADAAGLRMKWFVECPHDCDILFLENLHPLVKVMACDE